jgi:hypothetical protein
LKLRPAGGTFVAVTRELVGDELVWDDAGIVSRLERTCRPQP